MLIFLRTLLTTQIKRFIYKKKLEIKSVHYGNKDEKLLTEAEKSEILEKLVPMVTDYKQNFFKKLFS